MVTREHLTAIIDRVLRDREADPDCLVRWGTPKVGLADAHGPEISRLREVASPFHITPEDVLPGARTVVSYFLPFTRSLDRTNLPSGEVPSMEWAVAYEETNRMIRRINKALIDWLAFTGAESRDPDAAYCFDRERLVSEWSQRHVAWAAGLGTFGINNMLITPTGCCGRFGSIVTDSALKTDQPLAGELCIYKKTGQCRACVARCPSKALTLQGFDRKKCYELVSRNAKIFTGLGISYEEAGNDPGIGSEVCGKCTTCIPCAFMERR